MDFLEAVKRPYSRGREFLLFIVLFWIPIINFFAIGYMLQAAYTAMHGKRLERWDDWGKYFKQGFFGFVIGIVYAIPLIALIIIGALLGIAIVGGFIAGGPSIPLIVAGAALIFVLVIVFLVLAFLTGYLSRAALMAYIETGRFGDAFELKIIWRRAFTMVFFLAWIQGVAIGIVYMLIVLMIAGVLWLLTLPLTLMLFNEPSGAFFTIARIILQLIVAYPASIASMSLLGSAFPKTRRGRK